MDNTLPDEKILKIEKKVYSTPELMEHGILSEVTHGGGNAGPLDLDYPEDDSQSYTVG